MVAKLIELKQNIGRRIIQSAALRIIVLTVIALLLQLCTTHLYGATPSGTVFVESVTNRVVIGKLAGNRKLEFGVKNILEEYLQDSGYDISPSAQNKIKVDIVYLDVLTTKKNISVFHKNEEEVVIRLKGTLYKDGKKDKEVMVEESSSEISISTLIVDEGGKFNQTSLSNALKKGCDKLITKLLPK
jgi:hypothetical protein